MSEAELLRAYKKWRPAANLTLFQLRACFIYRSVPKRDRRLAMLITNKHLWHPNFGGTDERT